MVSGQLTSLFEVWPRYWFQTGASVPVKMRRPDVLSTLSLLLLVVVTLRTASALKVLAIFANPTLSHQLIYQEMMKALVARGHSVTVVSSSPLKNPLENYTDVVTSVQLEDVQDLLDPTLREKQNFGGLLAAATAISVEQCDCIFRSPQLQRFIRSGESGFDLAVVELLLTPCVNGLVHHVGSPPMAGVLSFMALPTALWHMGSYFNPAHMTHLFTMGTADAMTFRERLFAALTWAGFVSVYEQLILPANEVRMREVFGEAPPPVAQSDSNYSLLLQHHHWSLGYPQPLTPNVLQLRGVHLKSNRQPLPKDLEGFMAGSGVHGVVYCSFGSLFHTDDLTEDQVQLMMAAFEAIPQRVLWKWDSKPLPRNISNVFTAPWFPQQEVLADPRVKLFVTHGGVQSLQEAISHQVPLLGVPFLPEQKYNVHAMKIQGVALSVVLRETTAEAFAAAIREVILDPKYKQNMAKLSRVYLDGSSSDNSISDAVFWLEYAARHRGAPHLRSASLDLHWTQALMLDVVVFVVVTLVLLVQVIRCRSWRLSCLGACLLFALYCATL